MSRMVSLLAAGFVGQALQTQSVSVFDGGTPTEFFDWLSGNRHFSRPLIAIQEGVVKAFGPTRYVRFVDGSSRLEPPLPTGYIFDTKSGNVSFHAKFFPRPIVNGLGPGQIDHDDKVYENQPRMTATEAPRFNGSLSMKNNLAPLGWNVTVHPFFSDMRVTVKNTGSLTRAVFDQIAYCVGGKAVFDPLLPNTLKIEPDLAEVRKRAIESVGYFNPSFGMPSHLIKRAQMSKSLYSSVPDALLRKWVDTLKEGEPIDVEGTSMEKAIKEYRTAFFEFMVGKGKKLFTGESRRHLEAQRIYFVFQRHLCFDLRVQMQDGSNLHF